MFAAVPGDTEIWVMPMLLNNGADEDLSSNDCRLELHRAEGKWPRRVPEAVLKACGGSTECFLLMGAGFEKEAQNNALGTVTVVMTSLIDKIRSVSDKTIGLAQAAGDMQETARLQQNLIDALLFRQRNPKAALRVAKEARSMAQKNGDKRAEAMAVLREAMANGAMGKREEALQSAKQAQEFFQESYWPRGEAQCLHFMADLRSQMGDLDAALENAEERLAVLRSLHDLSMEANAMMQLANLHIKDDNFEEAERLAKAVGGSLHLQLRAAAHLDASALPGSFMERMQESHDLGKKDRNPRVQIDALLLQAQLLNTKVLEKPEDKAMKPFTDRAVRTVNEVDLIGGDPNMGLYRYSGTRSRGEREMVALAVTFPQAKPEMEAPTCTSKPADTVDDINPALPIKRNMALQVAGKAENRGLRALVLFKRAEHQTGLRDVKEASGIFEEMDHYQALGRCLLLSGNIKHALGGKL
ncbi:hypothetical protein AK812_SmicGene25166, partial [Symbiodinium microadriaticum]